MHKYCKIICFRNSRKFKCVMFTLCTYTQLLGIYYSVICQINYVKINFGLEISFVWVSFKIMGLITRKFARSLKTKNFIKISKVNKIL